MKSVSFSQNDRKIIVILMPFSGHGRSEESNASGLYALEMLIIRQWHLKEFRDGSSLFPFLSYFFQ